MASSWLHLMPAATSSCGGWHQSSMMQRVSPGCSHTLACQLVSCGKHVHTKRPLRQMCTVLLLLNTCVYRLVPCDMHWHGYSSMLSLTSAALVLASAGGGAPAAAPAGGVSQAPQLAVVVTPLNVYLSGQLKCRRFAVVALLLLHVALTLALTTDSSVSMTDSSAYLCVAV